MKKSRNDNARDAPVTAHGIVTDSLQALADAEGRERRDRAISDAAPERSREDKRRISQILAALGGIDLTHARELLGMAHQALDRLVTVPNVEPIDDAAS